MNSHISVVIPIYNEEKYIKRCIESILGSDYPKDKLELLLIDGGSSDKTKEIIAEFEKEYSFIKLLDNPKKIAPVAMNIGIKKATGTYIVRLDAHSSYPKNYFSVLIDWHKKLDADNVGTVIITDVKNSNKKSNSIKSVLSSPFGVGNSDFRIGITEVKEVDTVPFGCYHKDIFEKYGLYDERLVRNQDIEFNKRILNGGGKIYLIPDIKCTYYAREKLIPIAKNNYANGYWNILTSYYTKTLRSLSLRHFIPLFFVLSLFLPTLLSIVYPMFLWLSFLSFFSYMFLIVLVSFKLKDSSNSFLYLVGSFLTLHFSYGFGSLVGIFSTCKKIVKDFL